MTTTPENKCPKCLGCGQVANTPNQEAWKAWEDLPEQERLEALRILDRRVINPIACSRCWGLGQDGGEIIKCRIHGHQKEPGPKCHMCAAAAEINILRGLAKIQREVINKSEGVDETLNKVAMMTLMFEPLIKLFSKAVEYKNAMEMKSPGYTLDKASWVVIGVEGIGFKAVVKECENRQREALKTMLESVAPKVSDEKVDKPEESTL